MPKNAYVSGLVASAHDANTVYVAFDNHMNDDYNNYVYASVDGGQNFRSISEGIPEGQVVMTVAEDPKNPAVLYAGTEFGLFVSHRPRRQLDIASARACRPCRFTRSCSTRATTT